MKASQPPSPAPMGRGRPELPDAADAGMTAGVSWGGRATMLRHLPEPIIGALTLLLIVLNTIVWAVPVYVLTLMKVLVPASALRRRCERALIRCAEGWIGVNNGVIGRTQDTQWDVRGLAGLERDGRFLVSANHQSWADILVLQRVFNRRIPFLKFFLKQELIWVPILGLAWWGLDFPFMKRYSSEFLEKHPELRGKDLETTRRMCERFREQPVSVVNFLEGTRFTPKKHADQRAPYTNLLRPKAGGVAFILSAMGDTLQHMLDVTIAYTGGRPTLWQFVCGQVPRITVLVERRPIPTDLQQGDYLNDPAFRDHMQSWVRQLWADKDTHMGRLLEDHAT